MDVLGDRRKRALERHQRGALDDAEQRYWAILADAPDDGETWHYLAVLSGQRERPEAVVKYCREALRCGYSSASLYANYGLAQRALGDDAGAQSAFSQSLRLDPADADLTVEYVRLLRSAGEEAQARDCLLAAVERFPQDARFHTELGQLAAELNDGQQAETALRQAARLDPDAPEAWLNLGSILQMRGDAAAAEAACRQALTLDAECDYGYWYLAQMVAEEQDPALAARIIARAAAGAAASAPPIHFAAGKVHHDAGRTAAAFAAFAAGNRLIRRSFEYAVDGDISALAQLRSQLPNDDPAPACAADDEQPIPIFIVGVPRSGSTLIEHMLARHPAVSAGGEIVWLQRYLRQAVHHAGLKFPAEQRLLGEAALRSVRQRYHAALQVRQQGQCARYMTDKLPANYLCIPTIRRLFPAALIIHMRRDPRETAWSCYRHLFSGRQSFAYDLVELGRYIVAVHGFIDACRARWPGHVVELCYEALMRDPPMLMRALLQRLGLEWEPRCLRPEATADLILTASALQLRRGIAPSALGSAERYTDFLQPLVSALQPEKR